MCIADFISRNDDDENDDCSDNSNRSSDPFEFLIRPLMFSFFASGSQCYICYIALARCYICSAGNDSGSAPAD